VKAVETPSLPPFTVWMRRIAEKLRSRIMS
jgi:hypothetical protein